MKSATLVFCEEFHWTSLFSAKNLTGQADEHPSTIFRTYPDEIGIVPIEWSSDSTPVPSAGATGQAGQAFHWAGRAGRRTLTIILDPGEMVFNFTGQAGFAGFTRLNKI